ncbi:hypothetical protein ACJ41O_006929 [Fusarium nematophilum]
MADTVRDAALLVDYLQNPSIPDNGTRERLIGACQEVIASLETPIETARNHAFLTLDHAVVRSAIQLNIFTLLSKSEHPYSTKELGAATTPPCSDVLLSRLLRYLASPLRLVAEEVVDFNEWISDTVSDQTVVFVDVGGGTGGQSIAFASKRGTRPGRVINEDLVDITPEAQAGLRSRNIDHITYDFFAEQPITGACVYHFRQIFHDWPDDDCVRILRRAKDAMTASSTLLIDEVVLPEKGAHWMVTQRDLTMLALFNAAERSEVQWRALLARAGLRVEEIRCYDERMAFCIIVVKLG